MNWAQTIPTLYAIGGALAGAILTGIAWVLVQRRYGNALTKASENLVKITESQVRALESTLKTQKEHYEQQVNEWKGRSDNFEKRLHDRRNEWNDEKLALSTENASLKERPDLGTVKGLIESMIVQLSGIAATILAVGESLKGHISSDVATFTKIEQSLAKTVTLQQKILELLRPRKRTNKSHA